MPTKKIVADPDCAPEYDFGASVPNPYAERYARGRRPPSPRARAARVRGTTLIVELVDGRELRVPLAWFPRLAAGSAAARANLRITEDGRAISWPDLDEDLGVAPLLQSGAPG